MSNESRRYHPIEKTEKGEPVMLNHFQLAATFDKNVSTMGEIV